MRWVFLLWLTPALLGSEPTPAFDGRDALNNFLFPADADRVEDSLKTAFDLSNAGAMVTLAAKLGPEYGTKVAAALASPELQQSYRALSEYTDRFGPCQKQQAKNEPGWWSNYPDPPSDHYCSEIAKLMATLLWTQVHYCRQLQTGEVKPKIAVEKQPPYRLDEPPVKTHWLKAEVLYGLADGAIAAGYAEILRQEAAGIIDPRDRAIKQACLEVANELAAGKPDRELVALALGKLLIRAYESRHLHHLDKLEKTQPE